MPVRSKCRLTPRSKSTLTQPKFREQLSSATLATATATKFWPWPGGSWRKPR
jgi:hypothetical protein